MRLLISLLVGVIVAWFTVGILGDLGAVGGLADPATGQPVSTVEAITALPGQLAGLVGHLAGHDHTELCALTHDGVPTGETVACESLEAAR